MSNQAPELTGSRSVLRLVLAERVETALRYLEPEKRKTVLDRLEGLRFRDPDKVRAEYPKLAASQDFKEMYLLRVSPNLRAVLWYTEDGSVVVADLVSHDLLSRFFKRRDS